MFHFDFPFFQMVAAWLPMFRISILMACCLVYLHFSFALERPRPSATPHIRFTSTIGPVFAAGFDRLFGPNGFSFKLSQGDVCVLSGVVMYSGYTYDLLRYLLQ